MSPKPITQNTLFYGDNLPIMQEYIPTESIDLVYLENDLKNCPESFRTC